MMDQQTSKSKVTLEDLLRLKRAERPSPEFWSQFEVSLRQKQLQAIVEPRQWWKVSFWRAPAFRWISLSSGAMGAVAVAALVVNHSAPISSVVPDSGPQVASAANSVVAALPPAKKANVAEHASKLPDPALVLADFEPAKVKAPIADSLALGKAAPADAVVVLTSVSADESRSTEVVGDNTAADAHRSRLMAYAESSLGSLTETTSRVSRTRDRVISRLSDQALYDTMSRLDVGGNHLSIKF